MDKSVWVILPTRVSVSSPMSVMPSGSNIPTEHIRNGLVRILKLKLTPVPIYFRGNHLHMEFCSLLLFPQSVKKLRHLLFSLPLPQPSLCFSERTMTNVQWGICGEEGTQYNMRDHTGRHNERKNWMVKTRVSADEKRDFFWDEVGQEGVSGSYQKVQATEG